MLLISFGILEARAVGLGMGPGGNDVLFDVTLVTSVLSAGFGLTKFLKLGPCRLLGGYGKISFLLVMLNMIGVLVIKGFSLALVRSVFERSHQKLMAVFVWIASCLIPGFIYVRTLLFARISSLTKSIFLFQAILTLFTTLGPRSAIKVIIFYPALLLMPTFTIWTFGPSSLMKCCKSCCLPKSLKISFPLSWINLIITTLPPIIFLVIAIDDRDTK